MMETGIMRTFPSVDQTPVKLGFSHLGNYSPQSSENPDSSLRTQVHEIQPKWDILDINSPQLCQSNIFAQCVTEVPEKRNLLQFLWKNYFYFRFLCQFFIISKIVAAAKKFWIFLFPHNRHYLNYLLWEPHEKKMLLYGPDVIINIKICRYFGKFHIKVPAHFYARACARCFQLFHISYCS